MNSFFTWVKGLLDPFEVLYMAIAIATFKHTMWAVAFIMEGSFPEEGTARYDWYMSGALIAAAVDIGMLVISRYLQKSKNKTQVFVLAMAFFVAAMVSFYAQLIYTSIHTPAIVLSDGVTPGWSEVLTPIINAGVVIFPLSLPIMATVITLARIFNQVAERNKTEFTVKVPARQVRPVRQVESQLVDGELDETMLLPEPEANQKTSDFKVDMKTLTFVNPDNGRAYGPYRSEGAMKAAMKMVSKANAKRVEETEDA